MNFAYSLRQIAVITCFEARRKVLSWRMLFPMLCAAIICPDWTAPRRPTQS